MPSCRALSTRRARLGTPHDVAATYTDLASDDAGFVTGQIIHVNGGVIV